MIDENAIVSLQAELAFDVSVGPFTIIGKDVTIDSGTSIGSHVVIQGKTKIGKNNKIFQFASIGADPQHKQYNDEPTSLEIGDSNIIREYCSIHRGTIQGKGITKIGDRNFLMAYTHIAHDCVLQNDIIFANNASLAGHVIVGNHVVLGGFAKILQFCTLGDYSFVTSDTGIVKDVLPYVLVSGYHGEVKVYGLNLIGLRRLGFSIETLHNLKRAYNIIYRKHLTLQQILPALERMLFECPEIALFIDMLKNTKRGYIRS